MPSRRSRFASAMCLLSGLLILGVSSGMAQPVNDACVNALDVTEDGAAPAWSGSNVAATFDGVFPCAPGRSPETRPKNIWFRYTPSASGYALVTAQGAGDVIPALAWYPSGCGTSPASCHSFRNWFIYDSQARLLIPVSAGQPQLIGLCGWAGQQGDMTLSIRLLDPPCDLNVPQGASVESELQCASDSSNGGCDQSFTAFDPITPGRAVTGQLSCGGVDIDEFGNVFRDFDYFKFSVPVDRLVTISFKSQYPAVARLYGPEFEPGGCYGELLDTIVNTDVQSTCNEFANEFFLAAGDYTVSIAPTFRDQLDCGTGYNGYWLLVSGEPPNCPADIVGIGGQPPADGLLTGDDFNAFISAFAAGELRADLTGIGGPPSEPDGLITGDDFNAFISAFAAGCP